jgi:uncharacterized SAM-binding protein YcdF (DUF218 family)
MFWLTHLLANLLKPLTVVCLLLLAGIVALCRPERRRFGLVLVGAATAILLLVTLSTCAGRAIIRAERGYARFDLGSLPVAVVGRIHHVVVLGSGHISDPALPLTSQLGGAALSRIAEAVVILRQLPDAALIVMGGRMYDPLPHAEIMRSMAVALGVGADRIIVDTGPLSTREEVAAVRAIVATEPFVLVTSAMHMPRAVRMFREAGMSPIPAPTAHARLPVGFSLDSLFPLASRIGEAETIEYELLGSAWQKILLFVGAAPPGGSRSRGENPQGGP